MNQILKSRLSLIQDLLWTILIAYIDLNNETGLIQGVVHD